MTRIVNIFLVGLLLSGSIFAEEPAPGKQVAQSIQVGERQFNYLLFLPESYDRDDKNQRPWPMMLFLHGAGERGDNLELVKKHGPPKMVGQKKDFPFVLVSPQCPEDGFWNKQQEIDALIQTIDAVQQKFNVDDQRVYVTGLSMGGYGSWELAAQYPDRFAAVVPICGSGPVELAPRLLEVPIWAFHGDADSVVPLTGTTGVVEAIQKAGGQRANMTVYEEVGHDSWTQTYDNPELYRWLLDHRLDERAAAGKVKKLRSPKKKKVVVSATIDEIGWIQGSWTGSAMGGTFEETWNPPSFGTMVGVFKFVKDEKVVFYEILTIVEKDGSLLLRLKHFAPDLVGWEGKEESVEFPLVSVSKTQAKFKGLSFEKTDEQKMRIRVVVDKEGSDEAIVFDCQRR